MSKILAFVYGAAAYVGFLAAILYAIGFVGNIVVPKSIDSGMSVSTLQAIVVDVALLGLVAVQHSGMARAGFKKWWTRFVPETIERSTYVLISNLILGLLYWQWQPLPAVVWDLEGTAGATALWAVFWLGWAIVFASSFMIDHFDLFGLRQVTLPLLGKAYSAPAFRMPMLYKIVRHPLMLGLILAFWATPVMTAGHLLFAVATTGYILIALQLEERDLVRAHGELPGLSAPRPMLALAQGQVGGSPSGVVAAA
jgi:protein-S-isoprenylcysteine O-methyltransferase Ste14